MVSTKTNIIINNYFLHKFSVVLLQAKSILHLKNHAFSLPIIFYSPMVYKFRDGIYVSKKCKQLMSIHTHYSESVQSFSEMENICLPPIRQFNNA